MMLSHTLNYGVMLSVAGAYSEQDLRPARAMLKHQGLFGRSWSTEQAKPASRLVCSNAK